MISELTESELSLVRLSGALAGRAEADIRAALKSAAESCDRSAVEEALLQSYLFLGYPAALNGLKVWRELVGGSPISTDDRETSGSLEFWEKRGGELCQTVYAGQYQRLRDNIRQLHPDMERWMIVEGYGKVLGRPGLDLRTRELCVVGILAVLGALPQLYSHLRGALHAGSTCAEIAAVLKVVSDWISAESAAAVEDCWSAVRARAGCDQEVSLEARN